MFTTTLYFFIALCATTHAIEMHCGGENGASCPSGYYCTFQPSNDMGAFGVCVDLSCGGPAQKLCPKDYDCVTDPFRNDGMGVCVRSLINSYKKEGGLVCPQVIPEAQVLLRRLYEYTWTSTNPAIERRSQAHVQNAMMGPHHTTYQRTITREVSRNEQCAHKGLT
ncbi:hypothetical protein PROFUN_04466 [Planoprotostelium fungivorum]|nr:hypothetical protein PROFUN_04466 [Planoprotostelium fungivorum]